MVVQHNLTAMNSNRMLGLTTATQSKSTEKLSSGYKINRAADDAAGLSISEKMRKQIRGLSQASTNAQDGISAVQTAEGALNEVQDMLQRMNELAVKSANGTNSEDDRSYIQNEIDQLTTEIDRVAETTKFNETYLLKGDKSVTAYSFGYANTDPVEAADAVKATATMPTDAGTNTGAKLAVTFVDVSDDATAALQNELANALKDTGITATIAGGASNGTEPTLTLSGYTIADGKIKKGDVELASVTVTGDYTDNSGSGSAKTDIIKASATTEATEATEATDAATVQFYDKDGNKISANGLSEYLETEDGTTITAKEGKTLYNKEGTAVAFDAANFTASALPAGALTLTLHVGADATDNNQISVDIDAMSSKGLGVDGLKVDGADDTNARDAIDTIKSALQKVSTQRSALGAVQNRLEHTINNLDNVVENTTSAESNIRDTDMATEMVKYSNNNILAQAGQAMLAQANQSNQGVLSLLG